MAAPLAVGASGEPDPFKRHPGNGCPNARRTAGDSAASCLDLPARHQVWLATRKKGLPARGRAHSTGCMRRSLLNCRQLAVQDTDEHPRSDSHRCRSAGKIQCNACRRLTKMVPWAEQKPLRTDGKAAVRATWLQR